MDEYKQYYYEARPSAIGKAFGRWALPQPCLPPSTRVSATLARIQLVGTQCA